MKIREAYKIFEVEDGAIKNLFKGINGSRTLEPEVWHKADVKMGRDGGNNRWYKTGIHCLTSLEEAQEYLKNFRVPKNRVIIPVLIKGTRTKPTNDKVTLAEEIFIPAESIV